MLDALAINSFDRVVEFAPGLGVTARMVLDKGPCAYWGVEREPAAAEYLRRKLAANNAQIVSGQAQESGLPAACASVVFGEAMLSMQTQEQKNRIIFEARRLLAPGGRYGIHELCFLPDGISDHLRREIQAAMSSEVHVGVQPLSRSEWMSMFARNGLTVTWIGESLMHLLEPGRVLRDEGLIRRLADGVPYAHRRSATPAHSGYATTLPQIRKASWGYCVGRGTRAGWRSGKRMKPHRRPNWWSTSARAAVRAAFSPVATVSFAA